MNEKQLQAEAKRLKEKAVRRANYYNSRLKELGLTEEQFADSPQLQKQFENEFNNL